MTPDTIKQRRIEVTLDEGRKVVVRRMRWKAAREFMRALSRQIKAVGMLEKARDGQVSIGLEFLLAKVEELIKGSEDLVALLVGSTTDLQPEQIDDLDLLELGEVIAAAIELNLGADLKNCWTGIGQKIGGLVGAGASTTTPSTGASTPTSSMPATAPTT